jgi:quinol monooxygenase YgiN
MIAVLARVRIQTGREREFEVIFAERRARVLATEPDAMQYDLYRSPGESGSFVIIERFPSQQSYRAHLAASRDFERMMACFDGPPVVEMYDAVENAA